MFTGMPWLLLDALILLGVVVAMSVVATAILSRAIEAANPPAGEFVRLGDVVVHLLDTGGGDPDETPALLVLHGANLDLRDMRLALGDSLAPRYRTIFVDRPGQGHSAVGRQDLLAPDSQVAVLRAAMKGQGVRRMIIVGHSLGGFVALRYALQHPEDVAGLVLVNPASHPRGSELPPRQKLAGRLLGPAMAWTCVVPLSGLLCAMFARRLFRPEFAPADYAARGGLALGMTPRRLLASLAEYERLRAELARTAPLYPQVQAPTIIIAGAADAIVPPDMHAHKLADALPHARLIELPGAGHMAHHGHGAAIRNAPPRARARLGRR